MILKTLNWFKPDLWAGRHFASKAERIPATFVISSGDRWRMESKKGLLGNNSQQLSVVCEATKYLIDTILLHGTHAIFHSLLADFVQ